MRASRDRGGVRRRRISWTNAILAGLVVFGALGYLHFAGRKFAWWKQASFAGEVVGREACARDSDERVPDATALAQPTRHRFFLQIRDVDGETTAHEVVVSVYRKARVGDEIEKATGSYAVRRVPAAESPPAHP